MSVNTEGSELHVHAVDEIITQSDVYEWCRLMTQIKKNYEDTFQKVEDELGSGSTQVKGDILTLER
jgi:hypothetical protein